MKPFPKQDLAEERRLYNHIHSRTQGTSENLSEILANRWKICFTTINLELKYVEDVILTALTLHKMLNKNPNSVNVYCPASFADCILEDREVSEGEWCANIVSVSFYSLQVPQTGHKKFLFPKSVREN